MERYPSMSKTKLSVESFYPSQYPPHTRKNKGNAITTISLFGSVHEAVAQVPGKEIQGDWTLSKKRDVKKGDMKKGDEKREWLRSCRFAAGYPRMPSSCASASRAGQRCRCSASAAPRIATAIAGPGTSRTRHPQRVPTRGG